MGCRVIFSCLKELAKYLPPVDHTEPPVFVNRNSDASDHGRESIDASRLSDGSTASTKSANSKGSAAAPTQSFFGQAAALGSDLFSAGVMVSDAIVKPVVSTVTTITGSKGSGKTAKCPLPPHELKSLIADVVLLGAPLDLRVSVRGECAASVCAVLFL
jgi:hypothetical protein